MTYNANEHLASIRALSHEARRKVAKMTDEEKSVYRAERKKHLADLAKTYYQNRRVEILARRKELRELKANCQNDS